MYGRSLLIPPKQLWQPPLGTLIDWSNPLTKNLILSWPLYDGGGNAALELVNNVNGAGSTHAPTWGASTIGVAPSFNGTTQYYTLPSSAVISNLTFPFTISLWVKSSFGANNGAILTLVPSNANALIGIGPFGTASYVMAANGLAGHTYPFSRFTANIFQHWCIAYTAQNNFVFYLNGASISAGGTTDFYSGVSNFIGNGGGASNRFYQGSTANINIWRRLLSQQEAQSLYLNPWQMLMPSILIPRIKGLTTANINRPLFFGSTA